MEYKDYYQIMGVKRDATQEEIKRAYRKLARKYHPDVSKERGAEDKFKEVGEAYEVLKDPEKRAAYDQLGTNWQSGQEFKPPPDWATGFEFRGGDSASFSDFFESLFGGGGFRTRSGGQAGFQLRGEDHHAKVVVDLEDLYQGATRSLKLQVPYVDPQGHVLTREKTLNVRIPKGIQPGQHIRLKGQGAPGTGNAPAGDLYLEIEVRPHPLYRIVDRDLYLDLPVAPWEAALGAVVKVPTPSGTAELKIPPGSGGESKFRLRGRGLPGTTPGDFYVVLKIVLPNAHTEQQRAIYREMEQFMGFNPRAELGV